MKYLCLSASLILISFNSEISAKVTYMRDSINSYEELQENQRLQRIVVPKSKRIHEIRASKTDPPVLLSHKITDSVSNKYTIYQTHIERSATKWEIPSSLIVAMIHAESFFDPNAVSHASAIGLMQILVNGGAAEVSRELYDNRPIRAQDLFIPEFNIDVGTAYLHLLETKYLNNIRSSSARRLLAIASYNCGLSNLMKYSFGDKDISSFSKNINKLSVDELYTMLTTQLRIAETRTYVAKVYKLNKQYQALLN
jgi:membrane-bound lytic murein transglycosylase C